MDTLLNYICSWQFWFAGLFVGLLGNVISHHLIRKYSDFFDKFSKTRAEKRAQKTAEQNTLRLYRALYLQKFPEDIAYATHQASMEQYQSIVWSITHNTAFIVALVGIVIVGVVKATFLQWIFMLCSLGAMGASFLFQILAGKANDRAYEWNVAIKQANKNVCEARGKDVPPILS
jgi:type IV secretory pathway VirB2 component (pilin)